MSGFRLALLPLAAAAALCAGVAAAQTAADLTGAWSGALVTPQGRAELTLKIDSEGKAVLDNPAMNMRDVAVEGPTVADGVVRFSVPSVGGRYEGRLSEDRKTLTGTLHAGPMNLPLVLTHAPLPTA